MSDEQYLIEQTATKLFEDHCPPEILKEAEKGVWSAELWSLVEQTGLTLASIPAELGGAGGSLSDALAVVRLAGQFAVPLPLAETYLAYWVLAASGKEIPEGPLTVVFSRDGNEPVFSEVGERRAITGAIQRVPWAGFCQRLLVVGYAEGGLRMALVETDQTELKPGQNLAGEPRDTIILNAVEIEEVIPVAVTPQWIWNRAALLRATQMAGALEAILQRTVSYASERVQFGRPINNFQAIQQQLAILAGEVSAARISVDAAALCAAENEATAAIAAAKIRAGEAAGQAAAIAHQVHGAMGYTYEYPLHFFTKRLWAWRDEFGSESEWARWLGQYTAARGAEALWPFITD
jgi:alkylation response protein AidB-like acyl-CoA dehydrogenase